MKLNNPLTLLSANVLGFGVELYTEGFDNTRLVSLELSYAVGIYIKTWRFGETE